MIVRHTQRAAQLFELGRHARSSGGGPRTRRKPGRLLTALVVVARGNTVNYSTRRSFVAVAQASERSPDIDLGALRYEHAIATIDDFLSSACTVELGERSDRSHEQLRHDGATPCAESPRRVAGA